MKTRPLAFFVHCTGGSPDETFFPWLARELEKMDFTVTAPQFPTPFGQNLKNWMEVAEPYLKTFDENTILMGRSIGAPFVLRLLEKAPKPVGGAFLVASFCSFPIMEQFVPLVGSFVREPFDWKKIRKNCKNFFVYHSDNDPYLPLEKGEEVAEGVGVKVTLVKGAEHFGLTRGFTKFPLLLKDIKSIL